MKLVLQRVNSARVEVEGKIVGEIGKGYVALLGIAQGDSEHTAQRLASKVARLRIFADENGKTNLSAADVGGEILVISQFTLMADCSQNRPSFSRAADPVLAKRLYQHFLSACTELFANTQCGQFGAHMHVYAENDGPFTLVLEAQKA